MAVTRTFARSFAGGEISPALFGRVDDVKFQSGAALLRNFVVLPQGPAENRAGTSFVAEVKDSTKATRLIPFTYNAEQSIILEVGDLYIRFHSDGATLNAGTPTAFIPAATVTVTTASPTVVTWTSHILVEGDTVRFTTSGTMPTGMVSDKTYYVRNVSANTFNISATETGALRNVTLAGTGTLTGTRRYPQGSLVLSTGLNYYAIAANSSVVPTNVATWYVMPNNVLEIPTTYVEADLFDLHYVQSGDVLTIVHPNYPPAELRRGASLRWSLNPISFASAVSTPEDIAVTGTHGEGYAIATITNAPLGVFGFNADVLWPIGESLYVYNIGGMSLADGFYVVNTRTSAQMTLRQYKTGTPLSTVGLGTYTGGGFAELGSKITEIDNSYVVTAVGVGGLDESLPTAPVTASNNIYTNGSYNTINWSLVPEAIRYNVYKKQTGLYGFIGQTETNSFIDDNIAPDLGQTVPILDPVFTAAYDYPSAVSYFEQRRIFAGTTDSPSQLWMTRSGTESDMSYRLPTNDDDRISFSVAAREANTIRHIVPLTQLILLTSAAEWRVSPVNSEALTPTTISVRPQSYIGANNVQPQIINSSMIYCAARGGHVRELGYSWQSNGYITGDMSIRANHLFDNHELVDSAYSKAPQPIVWFVSSTGLLLGMTYVPEQQIGAWHSHDTDGSFESCAVVTEGEVDALYVVVAREIEGATVRFVERMEPRTDNVLADCYFVDCGLSYDGNNTTTTTITITTASSYTPNDVLTVTASSAIFAYPALTDIGDAFVITDPVDESQYRLTILGVTSTSVATAKVDQLLAVDSRAVPITEWALARNSLSGLDHIEGKEVSILADGAVEPQQVVVGGTVNISRASVKVHAGLPYTSNIQTLPLTMNVEAFGQGRVKNVNQAWVRVYQSSGMFVGPSETKLTEAKMRTTEPYGSPPSLRSDEINVNITPTWANSGQLYIRQSDPLPLTVVGVAFEAVIGS